MGTPSKITSYFRRLKARMRKSGSATSSAPSSGLAKLAPGPSPQPPPGTACLPPAEPKPATLPSLQEKIWNQAYNDAASEEPKLVKRFKEIIFSELHPEGPSVESTDRVEDTEITDQNITSSQMLEVVQIGIDRTKKDASVKQNISDGLRAVQPIMAIMESAVRGVPQAAVVWVAVSFGIDLLTNPITEALSNREGIQYVLGRTEWYWNLVSLLLDENKADEATVSLRDTMEKNITQLFQRLLVYQMRSACLYHRNAGATLVRDTFKIDNWPEQLGSIKEAEETVRRDMEQYKIQKKFQTLNDTTSALHESLQSIFAVANDQAEYLRNIHEAVQDQTNQHGKNNEDEKNKQCLSDLYVTDPQDDKEIIEAKKGGLLKGSYQWILEHEDFQRFRNEKDTRILWIKGDPGKGKTMLLCGMIDALALDQSTPLSYFFCQATGGDKLNTATSVLRGLIYYLARRNLQLVKYVREKHDYMGTKLFDSNAAWHQMRKIASEMLKDPSLENAILIVDALDECSVGRQDLLDFITETSSAKWIVSSRGWQDIEQHLGDTQQKVKIHLEMNQDSVSQAVEHYIQNKVDGMERKKGFGGEAKQAILEHLKKNSGGTFLWASLVCEELSKPHVQKRHILKQLQKFPAGLNPLYRRMLEDINQSEDKELYNDILARALVVYRPITLKELRVLIVDLGALEDEEIKEVINSCGSLLATHNDVVSFVHQSAKDYLLSEALGEIVPFGIEDQHQRILVRSLDVLCKTLKRDIYHLQAPGRLISEISAPNPDPLAAIHYACTFWIDHLHDSPASVVTSENDRILALFKGKYLQWLEALGLLRSVYTGVRAIGKLESCLENASTHLQDIVRDARRFLLFNSRVIEIAPLQVYDSALIFSPTNSLIKKIFSHEEPDWIKTKPRVEANWDACLQTLEGHGGGVKSVVFSDDGQRLASGSEDNTVKIWDATSGACLQTLEGHDHYVFSVVFSKDRQRLASGCWDLTVKIWDATSGACLQTLEGHDDRVMSVVFSTDGQRLASGSRDKTIKIWDATSGACLQTLEGHYDDVTSVVFSSDGQRLASGSDDEKVKIWDATSGACLQTLEGHGNPVMSVVFSHDGQRLASGSWDKTIKIWDATSGACLQTLEGHDGDVTSVVFSIDGQRLVSGSKDNTVKIWDVTSGTCLQTLEGHDNWVMSVALSKDGQRLASGSDDETVKIWDVTSGAYLQTLEGHDDWVTSVAFSMDGQRLASGSDDKTVKIWDATSGACLQTLEGHDGDVTSVVFSIDGERLVSGSKDHTIKIWDATSGACLQTLEDHDAGVSSVAFSIDGQRLASGSDDKTVKIRDATSGACLHTLEGHDHAVRSVIFSNDGQRLASGYWDKTVKIWDATSCACLQTLEDYGSKVTPAVFANNGQQMPSGPSFSQASLLHSRSYIYSLSDDEVWIMENGQRVLWLPPSYRPWDLAIADSRLALGTSSGRVAIMAFRSGD
ncbi:Vegetative incompatibility protein HET-E-1 [Ceratocystis fimbriata CBS 114723]|uniref:Vegetative incompatibility protein HET-E-1 n=1 Tax=Ceratocystis fimbriata CBS 114723 TaxID=1035309 RepID=A0A2C5WVA7_9PEZI|nr:Vegetative incompatibility protein HET-E-1 [Ceratocystis fimbriata CBS 114723]